ncbi:glycosyltransferase [Pseudoalteromonas porphyrae]|uniref:Glycosyltransferase n=1 Tax=Pseudoalteromonas porphyrae TaxID=187330 RepID=A0A0N0LVL3_9GAMM|nr:MULTISPECIES: MJ1255/VC2487 family glycosyltransferase [Pseudoalteromonas]KPH57699.1 glycosyltransferase [Pseudoalteromonas porphyrae]KPH94844.1 glycosyltransferase [Pseudoalteromonas porphyrae]NMR24987.1 glycosyltransferase [Pseudoalteromonas sp. NEC-BIFX-2020_015]
MRVLYGIQGTGNGHITRARVMANAFSSMNIDVDYVFSGRAQENYFDMEAFTNYRSFRGLSFSTQNGQINSYRTIKNARMCKLLSDIKQLDLSGYDFVFNDFEPITAWAAKRQGVPVIGMSHQAAFLSPKVPMFRHGLFHRSLIKCYAPADIYLGVHWQPFADNIIPPFIANHPHENPVSVDNKVLVYLPFENLTSVVDYLKDFPEKEFYCYHPNASNESCSHIHLRGLSRQGFLNDLANASGVIANAGFELSSEALKLGKKLLLKPLAGQFEQDANAQTLLAMKAAHVMRYLNPYALDDWINSESKRLINFPSDPQPLIEWLTARQWGSTHQLHRSLWSGVS